MTPGNLYMLRGLRKNKHEKWMHSSYGTLCNTAGNSARTKRLYADGDVFLCLGTDGEHRYRVLTPDGDVLVVWRSGNKVKFREV